MLGIVIGYEVMARLMAATHRAGQPLSGFYVPALYGTLGAGAGAARVLGLPVILLRRPALPEVPTVGTVAEAMTWLNHAVALRGV